MKKNTDGLIPLIQDISCVDYVNRYTPGCILYVKFDEDFTIIEASQGYFDLIGFSKEEVRDIYQNRGFVTLHPEDAKASAKILLEQVSTYPERPFMVVSRLVNKESGYKTVQFSGRLIEQENGEKFILFLVVDISSHVDTLNQLAEEQKFNNMIATLTDSVFFDLNLKTSTMRYSENFAERLGVPHVVENYPQDLLDKGVFSQEDYAHMENSFLDRSSEKMESELRFNLANGQSAWFLCHYQVLLDTEQKPYRVVGKMVDISNQHMKMDELKNKTLLDQQTGLYNKVSTEKLIQNFLLLKENTQNKSALIIIDVDNFKGINDEFGHMFGDKVLLEIASDIQAMFRQDDIVGRLGGDEFFVFMKEYRSIYVLEQKAMELCKKLWKNYTNKNTSVQISASIGISLYPEHGKDFSSLYEHADIAMYTTKVDGKNNYTIYQGQARPNYKGERYEESNTNQ